ncbi:hypothetical protein [Anaerovibrio lipolyticus]|uniref:hypothetical protein n=1 Tax=Anaerovibrio lipolyticus TaxID=82374 RepID=UPI0026EC26B8|nr:hypothetical protein [Anaerovibrio lipolyticus]MBE6105658.1 hypothetical protein [Anaerovibrio lipolyticus]
MSNVYQFPFGEYVRPVVQEDRTPKKVFVLGVYASAVHAKWVDKNGKQVCPSLAVASEPRIFWDGNNEEAQAIIDKIKIPSELGHLELPDENLNGPSARALENEILAPLGFKREDAWLCDLLPESRLNPKQVYAIWKNYKPYLDEDKGIELNNVTIPAVPDTFCDKERVEEITKELLESQAEWLILLGDKPIKQYLKKVVKMTNDIWNNLKECVEINGYGTIIEMEIAGKMIKVVPMVHPHHIIPVEPYSPQWHDTHMKWVAERKKDINKNKTE